MRRAWSDDSDSCAGGSVAIGGAFSDRQVNGYELGVKGYSGPSGWGWTWGLKPKSIKNIFRSFYVEVKVQQGK